MKSLILFLVLLMMLSCGGDDVDVDPVEQNCTKWEIETCAFSYHSGYSCNGRDVVGTIFSSKCINHKCMWEKEEYVLHTCHKMQWCQDGACL